MSGPAELVLVSGESLAVEGRSLPASRPLVIDLELGESSANDAPLEGRILAEGRVPIAFSASIQGEERLRARLEVAPGWLSPGRYVIEIRTTERSHLPLRRYALEVE